MINTGKCAGFNGNIAIILHLSVVALNQLEDRGRLPVCAMPRGGGHSSNNFRDCKGTLKWKSQQQFYEGPAEKDTQVHAQF